MNGDNITYLDSFRVEYIPEQIKNSRGNKNITTNIYRIQENDSIMCGYFCIGFINFMLEGKNLLDYTKVFPPSEYENSDKIILRYFQ